MVTTPPLSQATNIVSLPTKPVETSSSDSVPVPATHTSTAPTPLPTVVTPPVVVIASDFPAKSSRLNQIEAAITALQAFVAKKDTPVSDAIKGLRSLADEVYDKVMPRTNGLSSQNLMEAETHGTI